MDMTEETTPKPDAFEAALAANAEEISSPTPEVLETPVVEVAVDDLAYGGSGVSNQSFAVDVDTDLYIELRIPPLATVWFERV